LTDINSLFIQNATAFRVHNLFQKKTFFFIHKCLQKFTRQNCAINFSSQNFKIGMKIRISDDAECVENVGYLPGVSWEYELPGDGWYPDNTVTNMCHEVNINSPTNSWYSANMGTILCHKVHMNSQETVCILLTQLPSCIMRYLPTTRRKLVF